MSEIEERFREAQGREGLFYKVSFSIGLMEIYPADRYTIFDIIRQVDEKMYLQKRDYSIRRAKEELLEKDRTGKRPAASGMIRSICTRPFRRVQMTTYL